MRKRGEIVNLEEKIDLLEHQIHEMSQNIENYLEEIEELEKENEQLSARNRELTELIARNLVAWDTSKDKREGLLPEVYLSNKVMYKQLTGEEYVLSKAIKRFNIL